ncbi:MAG: hypothetical protein Q9O62_11975 [Ardenticatenia bacterium]|nr:hypothetical protein [Ardenticatenia bacterium]
MNDAIKHDTAATRKEIIGQITKVTTESRGSVQVVLSVPLHIAAPHGAALLMSYGQNARLIIEE